jgi:hypothetical protein
MSKQGLYRILVAIETDATRYHGTQPTRPALLGRADAEQMLAHIAADLTALLPGIGQCSLSAAGALYDQTQVLRPSMPVYAALESLAGCDKSEGIFQPGLISLGADEGTMPADALQPLDDIPLGLLQLLPLVLNGPAELVAELGQAMEHRFLEEGQLSAHSSAWLATAFGITINHARFMTLTDLNAMFRLQLEHFGFLPLWELLDAAMTGRKESFCVNASDGLQLEWREGEAHTTFETFDHWARSGGGRDRPAHGHLLAEGYADWTRELRRYLTTLKAHGVSLVFHLPGKEGQTLQGSYFIEQGHGGTSAHSSKITEHSFGELGTIAVSFTGEQGLENYYPLSPQGLNDIHNHIRIRELGEHTVAFPGCIQYDEESRALIADSNTGFSRH